MDRLVNRQTDRLIIENHLAAQWLHYSIIYSISNYNLGTKLLQYVANHIDNLKYNRIRKVHPNNIHNLFQKRPRFLIKNWHLSFYCKHQRVLHSIGTCYWYMLQNVLSALPAIYMKRHGSTSAERSSLLIPGFIGKI